MEWINYILFAASVILLFYSGGLIVRSLTILGRYFQLSEYVLSFILVAFATSLPELFVGISSAFNDASILSFGNVVGSNVLNIGLVLGLAIIFSKGLSTDRPIEREDLLFVIGIVVAPLIFISNGVVDRYEGILLLSGFLGYIIYLIKTQHRHEPVNNITPTELVDISPIKQLILFFAGVAILIGSSSFVVSYGLEVADRLSFPLFLVGILISIGTTLPEIVFSVKSVAMRHGSMSVGNALGSIVVNVALVMGLVAVINPINIENQARSIFSLSFTGVLVAIVLSVSLVSKKLNTKLGVILIFSSILFLIIQGLLK